MREPTARFLELTHAEYAKRLGKLSDCFEATFTDEPSLMNVFMKPVGHAALPWAPDLPDRFREQHGLDLIASLPALVADTGPDAGKVRCAFWSTVGNLVSQRYFGQIDDWCRAHGIASGGHLLAEENITGHVAFYGNFFDCLRRMGYPGIDCLTSDPNNVAWHIAKFIGSVADQTGALKRMSETSDHAQRYRSKGDARPPILVTADQIRGTCNLLYLNGINTTTSYYSFSGLKTGEIHDINTYVGRLGALLTGGEHVADVAVFYPVESIWASFVPAVQGATRRSECLQVEQSLRSVSETLFRAGRDFDYVDSVALRGARVEGDALLVGRERHRVLVLPRVSTLPVDVWRKVAEFRRAGGIVVAVGATPANSLTEFPSPAVLALTREVFGVEHPLEGAEPIVAHGNARNGAGIALGPLGEGRLAGALERLLEPDFSAPAGSALRCAHRRLDGRDFYLVINHSAAEVRQEVSFRASGPAEVWDPHTGEVSTCAGVPADDRFRCTLSLRPYGAAFVAFPRSRPGTKRPAAALDAIRPRSRPFEGVTGVAFSVQPSAPEHVACEMAPAPERDPAGRPATQVAARVLQGERDCWCFPRVRFEKPVNLSGWDGLLLHTRVPDSQPECGTQLMVFVEMEDGSLFLANAGRPLSGPARWQATPLWFSSLRRFGTTGNSDAFDPARVIEIRVGWGGYHARTGETVAFTLGGVELFR